MNNYSILINTCDRFEDCWEPFFRLFARYWPDYRGKIYLNTEYKDYSYPGLDIVPLKVCAVHNVPRRKRVPWSQCLLWALEMVEEEVILYMQEDYFLKDSVKSDIVDEYADLMAREPSIDSIQLTDQGSPSGEQSAYTRLYHTQMMKYFVSCQAALWRKDCLRKVLRRHESAWNFEMWGAKRAIAMRCGFYVVDKSWVRHGEFEIVPYIFTGIVGGRWFPPVEELFARHGIEMDYSRRGFWSRDRRQTLGQKIRGKCRRYPSHFLSVVQLILIKMKYRHGK